MDAISVCEAKGLGLTQLYNIGYSGGMLRIGDGSKCMPYAVWLEAERVRVTRDGTRQAAVVHHTGVGSRSRLSLWVDKMISGDGLGSRDETS